MKTENPDKSENHADIATDASINTGQDHNQDKAAWIRGEISRFGSEWHSPIDLGHGVETGNTRTRRRFARRLKLLDIPQDLSNMRVLDIGTWDGFFALEMERRGAEVIAIDIWDKKQFEKFQFVLKVKNSKIKHQRVDVHELCPERVGRFDLVLCAGVLYHCRNPLIALEKIRSVTRGMLILETVTLIPARHRNAPMIMFFPGDREAISRKWPWSISGAATLPWIRSALHSAGFNHVKHVYKPSFSLWKSIVALITNLPQSGRSITHARVTDSDSLA